MPDELKPWTLDMVNQTDEVVLVDFDNTITSGGYNEPGPPYPWVVRYIKTAREVGCQKIVIWSCRTSPWMSPTPMDRKKAGWEIARYLREHNIVVDGILWHPKPCVKRIIDDTAINPLTLMGHEDMEDG